MLSIKAFSKEGIRRSLDMTQFSYWMPLYFGESKSRTIHLCKKALSMIFCNNTKRFNENMVSDIFCKALLTLSYLLMDMKLHPSIKIIRIFVHIHSVFLLMLAEFPGL